MKGSGNTAVGITHCPFLQEKVTSSLSVFALDARASLHIDTVICEARHLKISKSRNKELSDVIFL